MFLLRILLRSGSWWIPRSPVYTLGPGDRDTPGLSSIQSISKPLQDVKGSSPSALHKAARQEVAVGGQYGGQKERTRSGSGRSSHPGKPGSIVGAAAFHDRVRDGNGWDHSAPATRTSAVDRRLSVVGRSPSSEGDTFNHRRDDTTGSTTDGRRRRPRPISTAQLKRLLVVHLPPINQLVSLGSYLISE